MTHPTDTHRMGATGTTAAVLRGVAAKGIGMLLFGLLVQGCGGLADLALPGEEDRWDRVAQTDSRIVGGSVFADLPAVGMLVDGGRVFCTGTLVGRRTVLTASHCLKNWRPDYSFAVGPSVSNIQHRLTVASATVHPQYTDSSLKNDIAYLTLAADAPIQHLGVVSSMDNGWIGRELLFVGYGVTNGRTQTGAGTKRAVKIAVTSMAATTFRYDGRTRQTCNGDSGGPAFHQDANGAYLVAGVTSYGDSYCRRYGVDTRVDPYLSFLGVGSQALSTLADPIDSCQGESYEGRCAGNTVVWCENQQVQHSNCDVKGMTCGFDAVKGYFGCRGGTASSGDSCQGETYKGRCKGDTVIWCEDQKVHETACAECGFDWFDGIYGCL